MAKFTGIAKNKHCTLETFECECGFHIGYDEEYMERTGEDISMKCPVCGKSIDSTVATKTTEKMADILYDNVYQKHVSDFYDSPIL